MRLIIADDNYATRLAQLFNGVEEFNSLEIVTAANLTEAKTAIDESDSSSTVVLTDMFLPDLAEPVNADEAISVYKEICLHYDTSARWLDEMIGNVQPMLTELYQKSFELRSYLREQGLSDYTHDQLMSAFLYEYEKREDVSDEAKARIEEFRVYERNHGSIMIETLREFDKDGLFDHLESVRLENNHVHSGVAWDFGVCMLQGFRGGGCEGMPMGIRIAEEAHKSGIPVVVVSGDHGTEGLPIVAAYLKDKGIISTGKFCTPWIALNEDGSLEADGKEIVHRSDFFIANKGYQGDIDYSDRQAWTDNLLIEIVRSLIKRLN